MATPTPRVYAAPALEKGFEILELLAEKKSPMALAQISLELNRSKSELYRMLCVLEARGYLYREERSDHFNISNKLFDLGMSVPPVGTLVEAAFPLLHKLADMTHQSCHLSVVSAGRMVVIARVESPSNIGLSVRVGSHAKLHERGSGKVLLAWMNELKREALYEAFTDDKSFDGDRLDQELKKIVRKGFYRSKGGFIDGVEDLSCPIFMGNGSIAIAALTMPCLISGEEGVLSSLECLELTQQMANRLSTLSASYSGF